MSDGVFTADAVVKVARQEIGTTEDPPGTNKTRYGVDYGANGEFWCGVFVWWVYNEAGYDLRENGFSSPKATNALDMDGFNAEGWTHVADPDDAMPGDMVIFKFGLLPLPGNTAGDADHCGILSKRPSNGRVTTIDGNTMSADDNDENNGGGVFEVTRKFSKVKNIFRPPFAAPGTARPQEIDMFLANVAGEDERVYLVGIEGKRFIADGAVLKELRDAGIPYRENVSIKLLNLFPTLNPPVT